MLLVNDNETEVAETHIVLDDGMSADEYVERTVGKLTVDCLALLLSRRSGEQSDVDSHWCDHLADGFEMLGGKDLGRCHQTGLRIVVECYEHTQECDESLS